MNIYQISFADDKLVKKTPVMLTRGAVTTYCSNPKGFERGSEQESVANLDAGIVCEVGYDDTMCTPNPTLAAAVAELRESVVHIWPMLPAGKRIKLRVPLNMEQRDIDAVCGDKAARIVVVRSADVLP